MRLLDDEQDRLSDSPLVERVMSGRSIASGSTIRPAETQWHMCCTRHSGGVAFIVVGPLTTSGVVHFNPGAEITWIKFRLGVFMPHLPHAAVRDVETTLPAAAGRAFWFHGSAWQYPDFGNADTFVSRLARAGLLAHDPLVDDVLAGRPPRDLSDRTVRHRFLRATGLTQGQVHQARRADYAAGLLREGCSILDTVHAAGYFDQPHLTRALKRWIGRTPAQLLQPRTPACRSVQDAEPQARYHAEELKELTL
jgi:AraC-like DNA-binding protein